MEGDDNELEDSDYLLGCNLREYHINLLHIRVRFESGIYSI